MSDDPELGFEDVDRDGIPDVLDIQVDPPPVEFAPPLSEPLTDEERLEMRRQADEQSQVYEMESNVMKKENDMFRGLVDKLGG